MKASASQVGLHETGKTKNLYSPAIPRTVHYEDSLKV